jgi:hypothetical protein
MNLEPQIPNHDIRESQESNFLEEALQVRLNWFIPNIQEPQTPNPKP